MNNFKKFIKKYFQNFTYFYRYLGYRLFVRIGFNIGVGLLDGFGLAMFLPLLQMVDGAKADSNRLGNLGFLVRGMEHAGMQLNLLNVLIVMCFFFIFKGAAQYFSGIYDVTLRQFFIKNIRVKLSNSLSRMRYKEFIMSDAGRIQNTMTGEVGRVALAYQNYFGAFQQVIMVVVYMFFAFLVDAKFAVLICLGGVLTNFVFKRIYKATKTSSTRLTANSNFYQGLILQFVNSFKYLKATAYIKNYNKKLVESINFIEEDNRRIGKLGTIVTATREPLLIIVVSTVILIQVQLLNGSLGTILISLLFFYRALSAMIQMQTAYNNFIGVSGSMDNMSNFDLELERAAEKDGRQLIESFNEEIEMKAAFFKYGDNAVLKNINLKISKNQTVAFIGESGCGKTTLVNVLVGLMPLSSGDMYVDGIGSAALNKESYQKRIGYITQEPIIFNDSIYNNVCLWETKSDETNERFWKACADASILDFIEQLPEKEQTVLGNNGVNLSGGQKQRISIARELYKKMDILVLDEATSALDSETERFIQESIDNLHGSRTMIVVAHRLSTIRNADKVYLMDKGEVIASGTFEEILESSPRFKQMVALQEI